MRDRGKGRRRGWLRAAAWGSTLGGLTVSGESLASPAPPGAVGPATPNSQAWVGLGMTVGGVAMSLIAYLENRRKDRRDLWESRRKDRQLESDLDAARGRIVQLQAQVNANATRGAAVKGEVDAHTAVLQRLGVLAAERPSVSAPAGPRVLLVEDDPQVAKAMSSLLAGRGYGVDVAPTVAEAVVYLHSQPEWVILDLLLPDGDGVEVLDAIRADCPCCRVAVVTGAADPDRVAAARARLHPGDVLFPKPVDADALFEALLRPRPA